MHSWIGGIGYQAQRKGSHRPQGAARAVFFCAFLENDRNGKDGLKVEMFIEK